jgi:hypothetical protein
MKSTPKTKKPSLRAKGSVKQLADKLNLSSRQIGNLLKEGMPLDPELAAAWYGIKQAANQPSDDDDSPAALRRKRIAYLDEQTRLLQFQIKQKEGELIEVSKVREVALAVSSVARSKFLKLPHELPSRLAGLSETKMLPIIRDAIVEILNELSDESLQAFENHEAQ